MLYTHRSQIFLNLITTSPRDVEPSEWRIRGNFPIEIWEIFLTKDDYRLDDSAGKLSIPMTDPWCCYIW